MKFLKSWCCNLQINLHVWRKSRSCSRSEWKNKYKLDKW